MKKKLMLAVVVMLMAVNVFASDEETAVRATVEVYFKGHATGDGQHFAKIFHPASSLFMVREGKFTEIPSADYIARASGKPAADEAQRKRTIENIDITGNAAVAKVKLDYPNAILTDYLSMLKIDGEWKVVNKIFYVEQKTKK
jgi:hypothetical protein